MMKRSVTRDEVARLAGVSPATVSYVINNGPRPVADDTRQKVQKAIEELGYQPNALARNLRRQRTNTLGLIIPDNLNPVFAEIAHGVEQKAFEHGFNVIMCHSAYKLERELANIDMLISHQVAGVLWIPSTKEIAPALHLQTYNIPFILLDRVIPGVKAPFVSVNNYSASFLITEHLIQLGHRRIAYVARPVNLSHSQARYQGYLDALEKYGVRFSPELVGTGGFRFSEGRAAGKHLLATVPDLTAIVGYNDIMAIGAMRSVLDTGRRVPKDVSIGGIDDIPQSEYSYPSLTTTAVPKYSIGTASFQLLLDLLEDRLDDGHYQVSMDVSLKIRESTGPVQE